MRTSWEWQESATALPTAMCCYGRPMWQAFPGDTVFDRAAVVGGVCLSPQQAKGEIDGVEDPVEVATPEGFMDKDGEEVTDERSE